MRNTFLITLIASIATLVIAGPGTHRYEQPGHSNYGDDKANKQ